MNLSKAQFMRELLSDMSDQACAELYDAVLKGHWMESGRVLDVETFGDVLLDHAERRDAEWPSHYRKVNV